MVQRSIASSAERGAARLAAERLDPFGLAMLAIPNQSVYSSLSVAKVQALPVRTGEPFGGDADGGLPAGFSPHPKDATSVGLAAGEVGEARRQAGQSFGQRGLSRRRSLLPSLPAALDAAGP